MSTTETRVRTQDGVTEESIFLDDVIDGLSQESPHLPCKYFYDKRGSELFDEICELDEYYLTRTELRIMRDSSPAIAQAVGPRCVLIELGSGSSVKTRILLDHLQQLTAYVPVDISLEHLQQSADKLARAYPGLKVEPVCADFTKPFKLPEREEPKPRRIIYFPGSTIGNFHYPQAAALLSNMRDVVGPSGYLLMGMDLKKDRRTLEAAYDDALGVTAEFNKNVLVRLRDELDADVDPDSFDHVARYNADAGRMEMYLRSQFDQTIAVGDQSFQFTEGDLICTEYSYKYDYNDVRSIASEAGWDVAECWTDERQWFGVFLLAPCAAAIDKL